MTDSAAAPPPPGAPGTPVPPTIRAAYCDVDGTLTATTIVTPLIWYKRRLQSAPAHWLWLAGVPLRAPYWLLLDRFSRDASNRAIYSNYAGMSCARARELAVACYSECIRPRLLPRAQARLAALKKDGITLVLVTGGLDFILQPLARELDADCVAPALVERDGIFTGELRGPPLTGEHKADAIRAHAKANNVDLTQSYAFGDAIGDLLMLECVGHPVAINADQRLAAVARARGWQMEDWKHG
ncbi:MAG: HAD-IB family hydrolase [Planctomycetota bacterium]|nr:HAD-IB family hydrolase [Planctomycetota bacterium]